MIRTWRLHALVLVTLAAVVTALFAAPSAQADAIGYLASITLRPGYRFSGPDDALRYGYGLCDDVASGRTYAELISEVKSVQQTTDEYQAGYLINQAIGELCPAQIWRLRQSAGGYRPQSGAS